MKIIILGAGLVGTPMALDLAQDERFQITLVDKDGAALKKASENPRIDTIEMDLSDSAHVKNIVENYDQVLSAVPGFMGFQTLKAVIEAGKNVVDIAFFPEDPFELHELAVKNNITALVDCGVAPGMSHILTGYVQHQLESLQKVRIYVGGLPVVRTWPYEYKAVFSPLDVIEEYTRPARLVQDGKVIEKPALSETELLEFPGVGSLEAFNSDGLRTLTQTISAGDMSEKTLRYPGHVKLMETFRHSGFFGKDKIEIEGQLLSPLSLTSKLFEKDWKLQSGERDLTVMQIQVTGEKEGSTYLYTYDLLDYFDEASDIHSMARTTGYTATVCSRLMADGQINHKGIVVPEYLGPDTELVERILSGLKERGIDYKEKIEKINPS